MNKKKLAILALAMSITAMPALAQNNNGGNMQEDQGQEQGQQRFEALKAGILSHLRQSEACVRAAADPESLRACMPNRGGRSGGRALGRRDGGGGGNDQGGGDNGPPDGGSDE